jgi:hypothetical protein
MIDTIIQTYVSSQITVACLAKQFSFAEKFSIYLRIITYLQNLHT